MATMTQRFHSGWNGLLERFERTRMRGELLERNDRVLADMGFSRELLEKGVSAWPWRRNIDHRGVDVTPEMVQYHIANARQLRAREVHRLARKTSTAAARAGRFTGRLLTGWARDRHTSWLRPAAGTRHGRWSKTGWARDCHTWLRGEQNPR